MYSIRYKISRLIGACGQLFKIIGRIDRHLDDIKIAQARIFSELNSGLTSKSILDFEFKVFSQWGEDGIIQKLIRSIEIKNKTFIEFGVEDFSESNCRYLMQNNNWSGMVIDGSSKNIKKIRGAYYYWQHDLMAVESFITAENIDDILRLSEFESEIGLLSVDIDGVDYFVIEAIEYYRPCILVAEYNSVFGRERKITVPYDAAFQRTQKHYSNLYFGASLGALDHLARKKGYVLVGCNSAGVNAFFVRGDLMSSELEALSVEEAYVESRFSEGRNAEGALTFARGAERLAAIRGLPVMNVETGALEVL